MTKMRSELRRSVDPLDRPFGVRDELTDAERVVNTMTHGFWGEGKTLRTPGWLPKPPGCAAI